MTVDMDIVVIGDVLQRNRYAWSRIMARGQFRNTRRSHIGQPVRFIPRLYLVATIFEEELRKPLRLEAIVIEAIWRTLC